jgi:hypothetical protein
MIVICSVGSKRGYIIIQSKERIILMETNSPASTFGARLPLDEADSRSVQVVQVPLDYDELRDLHMECLSFDQSPESLTLPKTAALANLLWNVLAEALVLPSAESVWKTYQSRVRMRKETFLLSFPQWLSLATLICKRQIELGQNLTSLQTTA